MSVVSKNRRVRDLIDDNDYAFAVLRRIEHDLLYVNRLVEKVIFHPQILFTDAISFLTDAFSVLWEESAAHGHAFCQSACRYASSEPEGDPA